MGDLGTTVFYFSAKDFLANSDNTDQIKMAETDPARSKNMSKIRSKDTRPEWIVRRLAHAMGYRYRLHRSDLPGKPDLVFPGRSKVIFVHGCFWHHHPGCRRATLPKSNQDYWLPKIRRNQERDQANRDALRGKGWEVLVIWECETRDRDWLKQQLISFLSH